MIVIIVTILLQECLDVHPGKVLIGFQLAVVEDDIARIVVIVIVQIFLGSQIVTVGEVVVDLLL